MPSLSSHCLLLTLAACTAPAAGDLVIGSFDVARGGCASLVGGSCFDEMRAAILSGFPGTVMVAAPVLTPQFLAGVDVVVLSSATGGTSAITPLSAAEQSALASFVRNGGSAILLTDNDTFAGPASDPANQSLVDWLGIDVVGTGAPWPQTATVAAPAASPITSGPFGTVTTWNVGWTGWFGSLPASAISLATVNQTGLAGLVTVPRHTLAACSGLVVVSADVTTFSDGFFTAAAGSKAILLNALALVDQPSCIAGLCGDIDADGTVSAADLGILLGAWGTSEAIADLDADGAVTAADLAILLGNWGACSPG